MVTTAITATYGNNDDESEPEPDVGEDIDNNSNNNKDSKDKEDKKDK